MRYLITLILVCAGVDLYAQCPDGYVTSNENLVTNGDFSAGPSGFQSDYIYSNRHSTGDNAVLDEGYYAVVNDPHWVHLGYAQCTDHTSSGGNMMVINGSQKPGQAVWKQQIAVKPNTYYYFSTWIANLVPKAPSKLVFSINGTQLGDPIVAAEQTCVWKQFFAVWFSGNATEADISIVNLNLEWMGNDFALDDIVFYTCEHQNLDTKVSDAKVGETIVLRNIVFDNARWDIKPASTEELEVLRHYLVSHKTAMIEIDGHTDNVGDDESNLTLSKNRAKAVYDYLISKGISKSRLTYQGFGKTRPIDSNETIEGRQKNRRVEFILTRK
ncbi:MAG: OmpA family protein [Bacteroidetes bacterium]|nr:OmpA family protein [Bacteroidota bacterium]